MPDAAVLTDADDGGHVSLKVGETVLLELAENPTTGFRWDLQPFEGSCLREHDDRFEAGAGIGAGGLRRLRIVATKAGEEDIRLVLIRPWGPREPVRALSIHVTVSP
jgi:inhibitor of cysteine peptidase